jgi:glycosyltransferase involved in cell wall biosynthesis
MKIALDARMIDYSGIGRYIQSVLSILQENSEFNLILMGDKKRLKDYHADIIEMKSGVYSPSEQWELFRKTPAADVFWSPHFNTAFLPVKAEKRIVTIHDVFQITPLSGLGLLPKSYAGMLMKNAVKKSDAVITISEFTRDEIKKYFHLNKKDEKKISVIYHYVNEIFHDERKSEKDRKKFQAGFGIGKNYILYVGNVKPHKNIKGLLTAFSRMAVIKPDYDLAVIGQKENFISGISGLSLLLKELGIEKRVHFTGVISDSDLVKFYNYAGVLVLPSFYEGFGYPPLEARACGCPSVVSAIPPLREVCADAAFYFDPASPDSILKGILEVLQSEKPRDSLIKKGKKRVQFFSRKKMAESYRQFLYGLF